MYKACCLWLIKADNAKREHIVITACPPGGCKGALPTPKPEQAVAGADRDQAEALSAR